MKLKKLLGFTLSSILVISAVNSAYASIGIKINNQVLNTDVEPQIVNGRTMVPVRAIFEGIGANVEWNPSSKTITGKKDNTTIVMQIGDNIMTINDKTVEMDSAAMIIDERTYAPARYVAEAFGYEVSWNSELKEVYINDKTISPAAVKTETTTKSADVTTKSETTTETTTNTITKAETTNKAVTKNETTTNTAKTETTTKSAAKTETTTKTAQKTETTTKAAKVETTTETTTLSAADIVNSSPVQGVGQATYKLIKNDINLAFKNYYIGNADNNNRFQKGTYSKLMAMWDSTAKTDEEKQYVAQSKIVYQNIITTCKRIDQRRAKHQGNASVNTYCSDRKDKLEELIKNYFLSKNIDEVKKGAEAIKNFASATVNK